jgi:hypothetical protein
VKVVRVLGYVRTAVGAVTVAALAVALHSAGVPPMFNAVISGAVGLYIVAAPFGAKYRKW